MNNDFLFFDPLICMVQFYIIIDFLRKYISSISWWYFKLELSCPSGKKKNNVAIVMKIVEGHGDEWEIMYWWLNDLL